MNKGGKRSSIDETPLRSDPNDFDRFIGSTIWFDMQNLVKERIDYLVEQLTQCKETEELIGLQHEIKAWKEMIGLPAYLKQCSHQDKPVDQKELNFNK